MPTPAERKALVFLSLVAVLGAGVRALGTPGGPHTTDPAARRALREQINAVEAARRAEKSGARRPSARTSSASSGSSGSSRSSASSRSSGSSGPSRASDRSPKAPLPAIDVDRASAAELESLPGIGPSLALRIVDDRNRNGPFGSITELQRVRGIGPSLSNRLTPHVTFSGTPRPTSADLGGRSRATGASATAPGKGPARPAGRMSIPP